MSIDERMANALSDLAGLIGEGVEPAAALALAAESYEIKPSVLKVRAAGSVGFEVYVASVLSEADLATRRRTVGDATRSYLKVSEDWTDLKAVRDEKLRDAIGQALQRTPSNIEFQWAKQARAKHVEELQARNHAKILNFLTANRGEQTEEE